MKNRCGLLFLMMLFAFGELFAQNNTLNGDDQLSIDSQFVDVIENSNSYKQFKVIELNKINNLKSNVLDTLNILYNEIAGNEDKIEDQNNKIESLENEIGNLNAELNTTVEERDSIRFLGMLIEKSMYKTIVWSIIVVLVLALLFFIYKYYNSQKVTVESKRELIEAHKELEEQRRKHIKKEQKIMRQLQDEINKNNR